MMTGLFSRRKKPLWVKVTSLDAEMSQIAIESDWTGRQLFDSICRIIGLRESWYFGLQFLNKTGISVWLQMEKLIIEQDVPRDANGVMNFDFLVEFYPENVEDELVQDLTRHLFFLQIKQAILNMELYCQAEAAVLLASYAVQAMYGDADDEIELQLDKLLPKSVLNHYHLSDEMWEERLRKWWANNNGLSVEDAEMEFLRVAQDLDMYGIQYYNIYNQKDTNLLLGVSAQGIGIYEMHNRLSPRPFFPWSEIRNIYFKNKQFTICIVDKSKIKFRAQEMSINMSILDLCIGAHNLYLRRRQPDLLEVQQMKIQAKEQKQKRMTEHAKLVKERERAERAELERDKYKSEVTFLNERIVVMEEIIQSSNESHRLTTEKLEQEKQAYSNRANEAEAKYGLSLSSDQHSVVGGGGNSQIRHSNPVIHLNNRNSPDIANLLHQARTNSQDSETNKEPIAPSHALSDSNDLPELPDVQNGSGEQVTENEDEPPYDSENAVNFSSQYFDAEIQAINDELEKARNENNARNKDLRESLAKFREEIEQLKKQDLESEHDRVHANNVQLGFDKYSVLRRSAAGDPRQRVEKFDMI